MACSVGADIWPGGRLCYAAGPDEFWNTGKMTTPRRIVLIGPMGAGKTTIGKGLAKELGFEFLDSDKEIEQRCGADIPWIFDVEGETGFRERERAVIEDLCQREGIVLATGGGAILNEDNRRHLARDALVVYLQTSVDQQYERTRRDRHRPLLQREDPRGILQQLMEIRDPLYRSIANLIVVTDHRKPRAVIKDIVGAYQRAQQ